MKEFQNQRAYPSSTWGYPFWLHLVTRHLAIPSSTPRVMLLFYRDPMEQAICKRQLQRHSPRFPFLLFPAGSMIFALLILRWSFRLASDRFKRPYRVARYRHLVLMVKVERRNSLTIHIPHAQESQMI